MRSVQSLLCMSLLACVSSAIPQESLCDPCVDSPVRTLTVVRGDTEQPSARWFVSRIREMGGELKDIAHDCKASQTTVLEGISFAVRACNWGGRYPALLFTTTDSGNEDSLVVLAANGSTLEILFAEPPSQAVFRVFDGISPADFQGIFLEFSQPPEG